MRRTRLSARPAEPIEQMTFEGRWEYACPYCGNLLLLRPGGEIEEEEPRCKNCGQRIFLPRGKEIMK